MACSALTMMLSTSHSVLSKSRVMSFILLTAAILLFGFQLGTWMSGVVNLSQMLEIQVGINLRGGDVAMAQQFLDCAQIAGGLQQVRGKAMSEAP